MKYFAPVLLMVAFLSAGCFESKPTTPPVAEAVPERHAAPPEPPLTEFTLVDSEGARFHSRELKGQVWAASFFFTRCASNCRELNMTLSKLEREFGPRGLRLVSISCDPQWDTPAVLNEYAEMYNAQPKQWRFLTGDLRYIQRIGNDVLDLPVSEKMHEDKLVLVDADGQSRGIFHVRQPEQFDRLRKLLDKLLAPAAPSGKGPAAPGPVSPPSD